METEELALLRKLLILWNGRKLILIFMIISCIFSVVYAYRQPLIYRAECHFLPPNQDMNRISTLTGSLMGNYVASMTSRIGGIADSSGFVDTVTNGQMVLGIMRQPSVLDVIIERFDLMEVYHQTYKSRMRDLLAYKILETTDDPKSGILTIAITDENPQRAAEIANAFVETLQAKMLDLSLNEAVQRRVFFEAQVEKNREALNKAESELWEYQRTSGSVFPESETRARFEAVTTARQQIVLKNAEISALLTYAREDNPRVKTAKSQLEALTRELERLEEEQKNMNPQIGIEYQKYMMNFNLATAAYEAVLKQYENARVDEEQGFFPLQVIDYATPPDFKYKPSKAKLIIVGTFIGTFLGCMLIVLKEMYKTLRAKLAEYMDMLPESMRPKKKPKRRSLLPFVFVIFAVSVIFFLTFQSQPDTTAISVKFQGLLYSISGENIPGWAESLMFLRTFAHIPLYIFLAIAAFSSFYLYGVKFSRSLLISLLLSSSIGLLDEAVKIFIPGREFDLVDWTIDVAGILIGLCVVLIFGLFRRHDEDTE